MEVYLHSFLTLALDVEWSASRPGHFTREERDPGTHWIGGWMGPKADLDSVAKRKILCPCRELKTDHPACSLVTVMTELFVEEIVY
jgi:hypothetical protein